ncbi:transient-receptor-potential-like protein isoform X1 [Tachypleus tridentatus]|uniref:transient-receptor-potential-like protein isoform X1 n=1 Tax=Tachypleus tridentatus TaxID=6853 RepID=UPI003FD455F4
MDSSNGSMMTKSLGRKKKVSIKRKHIPIPLGPLKDNQTMDPKERTFLEAAERGDKHTIIRCLQPPNPVNVNCTNILGRSAIQIAVDNENVEIVELLLMQDMVKIGDALLHAIREGVYKIVEMLINHPSITAGMLSNDWAKSRQQGEESSDYSPDISPVILAAHCNQFEILQLLLSRGAMIETPHSLSCCCQKCEEEIHTDSLRYSLRKIHTYRALASPAWISLTSNDPILTAFKLSWELEHLAMRENEFKEIYLELSDQCKCYSCDLLDLCRSTEEVIAVLNKQSDSDSEDDEDEENSDKLTLARLKLALKYEQKQFIAHPNCQQLLTSIWYEGLPVWRRWNGVMKIFMCFGLIACMPLIALYYLTFPRSKLGRIVRSPFMKFIYHSASFGFFLLLLVLASTRLEGSERSKQNIRGPPPSLIEWLVFFWVTGMVWAECKQLWEEGIKAYVRQWWNWLDFIMLSLFLTAFSLRAMSFFLIQSEQYGPRILERARWPNNDPTLIAEGVFAMANVFSFARIIYLFQTNPHLGPLQISLGCMIIDIAKFLFIFFLVLTSFACGLNQLYWYYDIDSEVCDTKVVGGENVTVSCQRNTDAFITIDSSYTTLLWSLFGVIPIKDLKAREDQAFTKWVGQALLGAYMIMAMTVMINMLIAMMSRSFQDIEDHADREWKFARSKLWMGYFDEGSTLPPPFNIIISPKSILYFIRGLKRLCVTMFGKTSMSHQSTRNTKANIKHGHPTVAYISDPDEKKYSKDSPSLNGSTVQVVPTSNGNSVNYQEVMKRLVSRYIHQTKKQLRQDGVNEDDLLEIKQDISSLRYELREDRKREAARNSCQIESIKRDIVRSLRGNQAWSNSQGVIQPSPESNQDLQFGLSHYELENLKQEIVSSLREEIRGVLREVTQTRALSIGPNMNSDLYQTHLYTQL